MPRIDKRTPWRRRSLLLALLLMAAAMDAPAGWQAAEADEMVDLTLMFHGSTRGKIAPCG